eukprot:1159462-Pelagomonas_calceolata.AAC.13
MPMKSDCSSCTSNQGCLPLGFGSGLTRSAAQYIRRFQVHNLAPSAILRQQLSKTLHIRNLLQVCTPRSAVLHRQHSYASSSAASCASTVFYSLHCPVCSLALSAFLCQQISQFLHLHTLLQSALPREVHSLVCNPGSAAQYEVGP